MIQKDKNGPNGRKHLPLEVPENNCSGNFNKPKTHSEPSQTSMIRLFSKIVNGFGPYLKCFSSF